jgi:choline-sulfatase
MDNAGATWKDFALSEYYAHNIASGFVMVRQGRHKYVYHTRMNAEYGPERELYDLAADPGEFTNLARRPGHESLIARMHAAMLAELERDPDETEQIAREMGATGYQRS